MTLIAGGTLLMNPAGYDLYGLPKIVFTYFLVGIAVLFWILGRNKKKGLRLKQTHLDLPVLCWVLLLITTSLFTISANNSLFGEHERYGGLLTQVIYAIIFLLAVNFIDTTLEVKKINLTVLFTALAVSLYAIAQHYGIDFIDWSQIDPGYPSPVVSTLGNANFLADYLVLALPIIAVQYFSSPRWRYYILLAFGLGYAALLFSYCRAGWIGFTVAGIVFVIPLFKLLWERQRLELAALIGMIIVVTLFVNFFGSVGSPQTPILINRLASSIEIGEGTAAQRLSIWQSSIKAIEARPLTGWGLETFGLIFPRFQSPSYHLIGGDRITDKTHNEFLQITVSTGLLSLTLFWWLITTFVLRSRQSDSLPLDLDQKLLTSGYLGSLTGYLVAVQFSFSITGVALLFWLILGASSNWQKGDADEKRHYRLSQPVLVSFLTLLLLITAFSTFWAGRNLIGDICLRQGILQYNAGQMDTAILSIRQATLLAPHRDFYRHFLIDMYVAKFQSTGDLIWLEAALREGRTAVATNIERSLNYLRLARLQLLQLKATNKKGLPKQIEKNLKKAARLEPYSAQNYYYLGYLDQYLERKDQALKYYRKARQLDQKLPQPEEIWQANEKELGAARSLSKTNVDF